MDRPLKGALLFQRSPSPVGPLRQRTQHWHRTAGLPTALRSRPQRRSRSRRRSAPCRTSPGSCAGTACGRSCPGSNASSHGHCRTRRCCIRTRRRGHCEPGSPCCPATGSRRHPAGSVVAWCRRLRASASGSATELAMALGNLLALGLATALATASRRTCVAAGRRRTPLCMRSPACRCTSIPPLPRRTAPRGPGRSREYRRRTGGASASALAQASALQWGLEWGLP